MVELLIVTLLIEPPVITVFADVNVITLGFINHINHAWLGLPVVSSKKDE
jgi:hypothetical protein